MLRNVGKYIFGDSTKQDIIQLEAGQLYIVRPNSVKGYSECMFVLSFLRLLPIVPEARIAPIGKRRANVEFAASRIPKLLFAAPSLPITINS